VAEGKKNAAVSLSKEKEAFVSKKKLILFSIF